MYNYKVISSDGRHDFMEAEVVAIDGDYVILTEFKDGCAVVKGVFNKPILVEMFSEIG